MSEAEPSTSSSTPTQGKINRGTKFVTQEMKFKIPGTVFTCGRGLSGQLGDRETRKRMFNAVGSLPTDIVQIAAGDEHTACLSAQGEVWTFGCNDYAALGRNIDRTLNSIPGKVPLNGKVIQISAGDGHTAALMEDGHVYMWGLFRDSEGTMKEVQEPVEKFLTPYLLDVCEPIIKIASGGDHILLLTAFGKVLTAGCADQGQLGRFGMRIATRNTRSGLGRLVKPHAISIKGCKFFDNIWATQYGSFVRDRQMGIFSFGLNDYGQLGLRVADGVAIYQPIKSLSLSNECFNWIKIVGSACNTIFLDVTGRVYCLGQGEHGLLGLGENFNNATEPTLIAALSERKIVDIGCGSTVFYTVSEDGGAFTWGFGSFGQMGAGEEFYFWVPQAITSAELERGNFKILQVDGGDQHGVLLAKQ